MTDYPNVAVTKTYSLSMAHIAKVTEMATQTGKSQGEILRDAIDMLYATLQSQATQPQE